MTDGEGRVSYWNEAAGRVFGYAIDEVMGMKLHMLISPGQLVDASHDGFLYFARTGEMPFAARRLEMSARRMDGFEFPVEFSVSAVQVKGEWYAISILRDITERKHACRL